MRDRKVTSMLGTGVKGRELSKVIFISKYVLMKHIILKNNTCANKNVLKSEKNEKQPGWSLDHNTFPTPLEKGIECSSLATK